MSNGFTIGNKLHLFRLTFLLQSHISLDHGEEPQPTSVGRIALERVPTWSVAWHTTGDRELPYTLEAAVQVNLSPPRCSTNRSFGYLTR